MYIYHNKGLDEYFAFNNLKRIEASLGINYNTLVHWFIREGLNRVDRDNWTLVKVELEKRKGSKK